MRYDRFILPILGEYSDSGYREPKDRILYSLRENAQYHLIVFGCGILGLIYVFVSYGVSFGSLKGLVMALAYCWGLALAIYLMGHGLVTIPRRLFRDASVSGRLRRIQARAPALYEKLEDAEMALEDVELQVAELSKRKVGSARDYRDWIEDLADIVRLPESHPRPGSLRRSTDASSMLPTVITEKYLADITRRLTRARHASSRYANEWNHLLQEAVEAQAILDSVASKRLDFGAASPHTGFWDRYNLSTPYTRYLLHYRIIPYLRLALGAILSFASFCIVWSELVKAALPSLSIIRFTVVHHWTGDKGQVGSAGQVISALWLLYMCAAALISVTEVKVWRGRALVRRNTAHESAFWYASQVARLSIPLSYNFMTFLSPDVYTKSTFYRFLGQLITMTTASTWFDYLFPIFILVPVCATLFGFYGKVKRFFSFGIDVMDSDADDADGYGTGSWREGRELIKRELTGMSIRGRGSEAAGAYNAAGTSSARVAPVLSVPRNDSAAPLSPLGRSPTSRPVANTSARRTGALPSSPSGPSRPSREALAEDDNFFEALGHRFKNTIDTFETPRWLQELGDGIKKPKWIGNDDEEGAAILGGGASSSGRNDSDVRRWFGGAEGNIRL